MNKRILLFIDCLGAGGAQRQFVGLATMLKRKGYEVKVITYYDIPFYKSQLEADNVETECVAHAQSLITRIPAICKAIYKFKPDWVVSFLDTPCVISCIAKIFSTCKFKLLVSERNTTQKLTFRERIKFFLYRFSDIIVPNAYAQGEFIVKHYANLSSKVNVIHNFVDTDHFVCKSNIEKNNVPQIITVASIWPPKNTLGFIESVKILADQDVKCQFHWYGKVNFAEEYLVKCEQKIKDYKLENYLILHEKTKNIKDVYSHADFFCLPSFHEGTPNVICEAMATGLPIVCSDVCDNARYVQTNENGLLFNPQDPHDIADKLKRVISVSRDEYKRMSKYSRQLAEKNLSKDSFLDKYLKIFK